MNDLKKMCSVVMDEIDKIADKGLTTSNLETAYKLIDMIKDIKTVESMEEEYVDDDGYAMRYMDDASYARGRGRNAKRDAMGRYRRTDGMDGSYRGYRRGDERYSQAKMDYRQSRAGKQDVMDSLKEKMHDLKKELQDMSKDSDFPEERQEIDKYVQMLDRLM